MPDKAPAPSGDPNPAPAPAPEPAPAPTSPAPEPTPTPPAPALTSEQQAAVEAAVKEQLKKDREAEQKRQQREQQAATERQQQEQGQFQQLAEQRAQRIAEMQTENDLLVRKLVCQRHNLSEDMAPRLQGKTEAELDDDAKKVGAMLAPPPAPDTEAGKGNKPTAPAAPQTAGAGASSNGQKPPQAFIFQERGDVAW